MMKKMKKAINSRDQHCTVADAGSYSRVKKKKLQSDVTLTIAKDGTIGTVSILILWGCEDGIAMEIAKMEFICDLF